MPLHLITGFIKKNKTSFGLALFGGIIGSITTIVISLSLGNYYQIFFHQTGSKTTLLNLMGLRILDNINAFFIFYAVLLFIKVISDWVFYYFSKNAAVKLVNEMRINLFNNEIYDTQQSGLKGSGKKVVKYGTDMQSIHNFYTKGILTFIKDVCLLAIGFAFLLKINGTLSLIMLGALPALLGINYLFARHLEPLTLSKRNSQSQLMNFVNNSFQATDTLRAFRKEKIEIKRFSKLSQQLQGVQIKYYYYFAYIQALVPVLLYTITGLILFMVAQHQISIKATDLMAFVLISILQFSALRRVVKVETIWRTGLLSLKKISEKKSIPSKEINNLMHIGNLNSLRFDKLNIDESNRLEFEINSAIKPGTINCISCTNPDSLIEILSGLNLKFTGKILINKKPIQNIQPQSLNRLFSFATNRFPLLGNSIYEMVTTGKKAGTKLKTIEILNDLGWNILEPKIDLPKGIRQSHIELTHAHRHLLIIARAILYNRPILVLNKPFNGLSETIAERCHQFLETLLPSRTIIIISESKLIPFIRLDFQEALKGKAG